LLVWIGGLGIGYALGYFAGLVQAFATYWRGLPDLALAIAGGVPATAVAFAVVQVLPSASFRRPLWLGLAAAAVGQVMLYGYVVGNLVAGDYSSAWTSAALLLPSLIGAGLGELVQSRRRKAAAGACGNGGRPG